MHAMGTARPPALTLPHLHHTTDLGWGRSSSPCEVNAQIQSYTKGNPSVRALDGSLSRWGDKVASVQRPKHPSPTRKASKRLTLHQAAHKGDVISVKRLIKQFEYDKYLYVNSTSAIGETALHVAAGMGRVSVVSHLLSQDAMVNIQDPGGMTPLHCAVLNGRCEVAELLISQGADINHQDGKGNTAMHLAAMRCHKDILEMLVKDKYLDPLLKTKRGRTVLHMAVVSGRMDIVKMLLDSNCGFDINAKDKSGQTALYLCSKEGDSEMLRLLIANGADVNISDHQFITPLHLASNVGFEDIVHFLLANGAEPHLPDYWGNTPLDMAWTPKIKCLLKVGVAKDTNQLRQLPLADQKWQRHLLVAQCREERPRSQNMIRNAEDDESDEDGEVMYRPQGQNLVQRVYKR